MTSSPTTIPTESSATPDRSLAQVPSAGFLKRLGLNGLGSGDLVFLGILAVAAIWIWARDLAWLAAAEETLPILAALPLFVWLGAPWRFREGSWSLPGRPLAAVGLMAVTGLALDITLLLALAWTYALWLWLKVRVVANPSLLRRLAILPLLAFPWIALDLTPVGWGFRLSAAWVADHLYSAVGFTVAREGIMLQVSGIPIEVAAPCSGMNSLQAILLGGLVLTWMEFGRNRSYWWMVASLPLMSWIANTMRVCSVIATAVGLGPDAARGSLHQIGGWVVVLMVCLLWSWMLKCVANAHQQKKAPVSQ